MSGVEQWTDFAFKSPISRDYVYNISVMKYTGQSQSTDICLVDELYDIQPTDIGSYL